MQAKRDENRITVAMGVSSVDFVTPLPLKVDPVTGYLLVHIIDTSTAGAVSVSSIARRDQNYVTSKMGITDDVNEVVQNLITHNDYLAIKMT